jgi:hypothetical protein
MILSIAAVGDQDQEREGHEPLLEDHRLDVMEGGGAETSTEKIRPLQFAGMGSG